jgi:hypothetical protein
VRLGAVPAASAGPGGGGRRSSKSGEAHLKLWWAKAFGGEGGEEGVASVMFQELVSVLLPGKALASIWTGDEPALSSISGRVFERAAVGVSSWKRPAPCFGLEREVSSGFGGGEVEERNDALLRPNPTCGGRACYYMK